MAPLYLRGLLVILLLMSFPVRILRCGALLIPYLCSLSDHPYKMDSSCLTKAIGTAG